MISFTFRGFVVLRHLRSLSGLTAAELAKKAGVTPNYLTLVETGKKPPSYAILCRLAKAYDIPVATLQEMVEETVVTFESTRGIV